MAREPLTAAARGGVPGDPRAAPGADRRAPGAPSGASDGSGYGASEEAPSGGDSRGSSSTGASRGRGDAGGRGAGPAETARDRQGGGRAESRAAELGNGGVGAGLRAAGAAADLAALVGALSDEERASRELCELERQKQRVLVAGAATELPALVQAEQVMLAGLSRSEVRRVAATRALAAALGLPGSAPLERLAGSLDEPSASGLREVGRRIAANLAEIRDLNEQNAALIRQSLAFVRFSLGVLGRASGDAGTYAAGGRRPRPEIPPRALDREV
jgi:flagellar biosynthesis/type III secretory pathway chaperone